MRDYPSLTDSTDLNVNSDRFSKYNFIKLMRKGCHGKHF